MFGGLAEQNRHLVRWECQVADGRIHGTTRRQVRKVFSDALLIFLLLVLLLSFLSPFIYFFYHLY